MLEYELIRHCAPTLAGLKPASLFTYQHHDFEQALQAVSSYHQLLMPKGIRIRVVSTRPGSLLLYVYNPKKLSACIAEPESAAFLKGQGYDCTDVNAAISRLSAKLQTESGFPHEIGLFLGFPLHDVLAFIKHNGQNCKLCGYWKVYHNETQAKALFETYKKCTEILLRHFDTHRNFVRLCAAL